ncbi:MAG: hypothetical protein MUD14_14535 [Hydrococcus sp. Prado102]|nr:hypothetical protein [Hydrococcus sp. Prado102]
MPFFLPRDRSGEDFTSSGGRYYLTFERMPIFLNERILFVSVTFVDSLAEAIAALH